MVWTTLRSLLVVLAVAGLFGQTTVRAMPMQALAAEASSEVAAADHCAQMAEAAAEPATQPDGPCKQMTPECIGKMGCAVAVMEPPQRAVDAAPVRYASVAYRRVSEAHPGLSVSPELFPPIIG